MPIKYTKGQPITGSRKEMSPRSPITNPNNQARQAQSQIAAPPAPFKTKSSLGAMPTAGSLNTATLGQPYGNTSLPGQDKRQSPGTAAPLGTTRQMLAAVGYDRLPNYAGRAVHSTGPSAPPRRSSGASRKMKATYPGIFGSKKY